MVAWRIHGRHYIFDRHAQSSNRYCRAEWRGGKLGLVGFSHHGHGHGILYAKLWRRTDVITDIAFYEARYTGKSAGLLRGFRALYLGVFFNIMIMASVTLAAIKIGGVMLGLSLQYPSRRGSDRNFLYLGRFPWGGIH